jgi:outer membrane murein-binding lipoprotein Lpp
MRKRGYIMLGTVVLSGALLAGCSADGATDQASSSGENQAAAPAAGQADTQGEARTGADAGQGKDTTAESPDLRVDQRSIIYTGTITVQVKDVNAAAAQATGISAGTGGFIGGDDRQSGGGGTDTATLKLRIPADKFSSALEQIAKLGTEKSRAINTEDVTEQVVDLDARISVQQARVDSGRKLLGQAKTLNDLVMLEKEVATRESDLASLQAKKRRLADLSALSTVTVVLLGPDVPAPAGDSQEPGFLSGLSDGWHGLLASLSVLLVIIGALLPWLLVLGPITWLIVHLRRRFQRADTARRLTTPAETADSSPATP